MRVVTFSVPFVTGKGRPRFVRRSGRAYTPPATAQAEADVRKAWQRAAQGAMAPEGAAVTVRIRTMRTLPASRPKRVATEPDTHKPDIDNIAKLVLDALNGEAWHDDAQVTALDVRKMPRARAVGPHTLVRVSWPEKGEER